MSQTGHRSLNITDHKEKEANHQDAAPNLGPMSKFTDSSEPLFTMYCKMTEHHNKKVGHWVKAVDNIAFFVHELVFFSRLLSITVPDLKQDPQDTSAFYLENIYKLQVLADSKGSLPSSPAQPPPFSAPNHAIWVNTLLFLSLCLNSFTAFMALSVRGFITRYLLETGSPQLSPHYRARIREILVSETLDSLAVNALTAMLWFSSLFFYVGVSIYLFNINHAVFGPVLSCICLCFITIIFASRWLIKIEDRSESSAGIDDRVLGQLFDVLVDDSDFVQFFESIPGFCQSSIVDDPLQRVTRLGKEELHKAVKELLDHTCSSKFLSYPEKMRRIIACVNFADAVRLPDIALSTLKAMLSRDWHNALRTVELGQILKSQANRSLERIGLCAQSIVAGIISNVQESDERWVSLTADQLGESEDVIRSYLERGNDNVLLANLTYITRQIFHSLEDNWDMAASSASILPSLSNFDVRNTLPELQSRFRALWDEIEQAPNNPVRTVIRDSLLNLHNVLIQGTDDTVTGPSASNMTNPSGNPSEHHAASLAVSPPRSLLPTSGHITADLADELSSRGIPEATQQPITATASSPPMPLGSQGQSGTSQAVASTATAVRDDTVNTQSGEQPTVRPNSSSVLLAMATSTPSSINTTPEVASVFRSHVTGTPPFIAHHNPPDLSDPIEMESPHSTGQSGALAEHLDPSDNPPSLRMDERSYSSLD